MKKKNLDSNQYHHNHILSCNESDRNRQIVSISCKRKATEELFVQPKKIILKELSQNS